MPRYYVSLILTLTINPAIDRTYTADKLAFEDRGYILDQTEVAGGRGLNASQVIQALGGETLALLTLGGEVGERIEASLQELAIPFEAVRTKAESRENMTISGQQGLTVKLNEKGEPLTGDEVEGVRQLVQQHVREAKWLMICGSTQPGVPPMFYAELVKIAQEAGVKVLVDTDEEDLLHAMEVRPTAVAPNHNEAERLLGRAILTRTQSLEAVKKLQAMGPEMVCLSLGSRGALGCTKDQLIEAVPPRVEALCPIGAGDALAAAFVWAMEQGSSFEDAVRWGVAAGTASAMLPGTNFPQNRKQIEDVYKNVQVRTVS